MVADDEASRAVWLGKDGAAATMKAGSLAIECSTVSHQHALDMARELRGRGLSISIVPSPACRKRRPPES